MEGDCKLMDGRMLGPEHQRTPEIANTSSMESRLYSPLLIDHEI